MIIVCWTTKTFSTSSEKATQLVQQTHWIFLVLKRKTFIHHLAVKHMLFFLLGMEPLNFLKVPSEMINVH